LIPPGKSGNVLATIAIGEQYLQPFMKYAYHTWEMYCHRHDLGLILFDEDLISPNHPKWKNYNYFFNTHHSKQSQAWLEI